MTDSRDGEPPAALVIRYDPLWRSPLHKPYKKKIESKIADIASCSFGPGGSITAALFLREFVKDTPGWVHIDTGASTPGYMAGPGRAEGGEAFAVRALYRFLHDPYTKTDA
ncbi:hypothetical protein BSKO_09644 [Bryopsis sp. KO-2023]|nr:hypothetical protein BSKO_09644 [Bryopsis sp. KO-2023]